MYAVADPGFPLGGALTRWGGANLRCIHFLAKMYVKMKEIDPVWGGGGCTSGTPLDPPMVCTNHDNHRLSTRLCEKKGFFKRFDFGKNVCETSCILK